jgi:hypothetical protein
MLLEIHATADEHDAFGLQPASLCLISVGTDRE